MNIRFAVGAVSGSSIVVCTIALGACLWIGTSARKTGSVMLQPAVDAHLSSTYFSLGEKAMLYFGMFSNCYCFYCSHWIHFTCWIYGFEISKKILTYEGVGYYLWFLYFSLVTKKENDDEISKQQETGDVETGTKNFHSNLILYRRY